MKKSEFNRSSRNFSKSSLVSHVSCSAWLTQRGRTHHFIVALCLSCKTTSGFSDCLTWFEVDQLFPFSLSLSLISILYIVVAVCKLGCIWLFWSSSLVVPVDWLLGCWLRAGKAIVCSVCGVFRFGALSMCIRMCVRVCACMYVVCTGSTRWLVGCYVNGAAKWVSTNISLRDVSSVGWFVRVTCVCVCVCQCTCVCVNMFCAICNNEWLTLHTAVHCCMWGCR